MTDESNDDTPKRVTNAMLTELANVLMKAVVGPAARTTDTGAILIMIGLDTDPGCEDGTHTAIVSNLPHEAVMAALRNTLSSMKEEQSGGNGG